MTQLAERQLTRRRAVNALLQIPQYQFVDGERDPAAYRARYDAEIRYVDDREAPSVVGRRWTELDTHHRSRD